MEFNSMCDCVVEKGHLPRTCLHLVTAVKLKGSTQVQGTEQKSTEDDRGEAGKYWDQVTENGLEISCRGAHKRRR